MLASFSLVASAALHLPALGTTHRPALLAQCSASLRCSPICLQIDDNDDFDGDSMEEAQRKHFFGEAEECVVSDSGETCFVKDYPNTPPPATTINEGPPQIDEDRRRRSPGINRNFWDLSQEEFKKPWGGNAAERRAARIAAAPTAPTPTMNTNTIMPPPGGNAAERRAARTGNMPPPVPVPRNNRPASRAAPPPVNPSQPTGPPPVDPRADPYNRGYGKISDDRAKRSPGIANNFWDMSQADFKKPWGGPVDPALWEPGGAAYVDPETGQAETQPEAAADDRARLDAWLDLAVDNCDDDDCIADGDEEAK